jgi:peptidoglycan-associated lipoprotein
LFTEGTIWFNKFWRKFLGEDSMRNVNWKAIITVVFCIFLTVACSKKLMPPEIETSGSVSEGTEFTASSSSESEKDFAGSGGPEDSGFFSEEPILESGPGEGSPVAGSGNGGLGSSGQADIGNGSSGAFEANPFASSGQGGGSAMDSGSSGSADSGIQESRLQSFQASADLKDIHFEFDKFDLDGKSREILKENAEFLKRNPGLHIEIQGHCDERGTNNYNIALGERRAHSTRQYLLSQGVDSKNVHTISYGEEKPFCFESSENCWHENRRAHFMVSK